MSDPKFNPGPWEASSFGDYSDFEGNSIVVLGDDMRIAAVHADAFNSQGAANAQLIAAAPDMHNDGQFLVDRVSELDFSDVPESFMRDWYGHVEPALSRMKAALAKARGET